MRGAWRESIHTILPAGIIPAYAGSTLSPSCQTPLWWDYPRVCGEHKSLTEKESAREGSSPRMRGALEVGVGDLALPGIIPAYAGSTWTSQAGSRTRRDHPRVCGEHAHEARPSSSRTGSSPRMRGARGDTQFLRLRSGIIPAYAGSTVIAPCRPPHAQDHPRVCGEHGVSSK